MKIFLKTLAAVLMTTLVFTACNKVEDLPVYGNGSAVQLSATSQTLAATAADSAATARPDYPDATAGVADKAEGSGA